MYYFVQFTACCADRSILDMLCVNFVAKCQTPHYHLIVNLHFGQKNQIGLIIITAKPK